MSGDVKVSGRSGDRLRVAAQIVMVGSWVALAVVALRKDPSPAPVSGPPVVTGAGMVARTPAVPAARGDAYTDEEIEYLLEVALGAEYGSDRAPFVRKWATEVRIAVLGSPTGSDREAVRSVIGDVNAIQDAVELRLVAEGEEKPNMEIHFAARSRFHEIEPNYVAGNPTFFWMTWAGSGEIRSARILIDSEGLDPEERAGYVREEMAQGLGLPNSSPRVVGSVFNDYDDDHPTTFHPMDRKLIEMLYRPELRVGNWANTAETVLRRL